MPTRQAQLTDDQIAYLRTQPLGRLATVTPGGAPQNKPVGFTYNADLGTIDIGGHNMGASRKFQNLAAEPRVAFVVDDVVSTQPWQVRFIEIRGTAEALRDQPALGPGFSNELIRIRPDRVLSYGL
ncbi:PPOX class F420-dependent oxidoreductase [Aldersonia sp. NBC_00410]|uniref:PPOX class F420-dependent oxidoreductase n=1 Tax=Aldersonia sp. NBC_00410 TaxID=2975954 RepID=UPI002252EEA1|nr:PPOX class F420-dependent oxidoreductase [Aldersonia sp. NBC_00410]MCX5041939.1 PPOX class F420-dependent oxidoreductase [Aldersonia sp. NBC_00410]